MEHFDSVWKRHKRLPDVHADGSYFNADFAPVWSGTKGFEGKYQAMAKDTANYCPAQGKPGSQLIGTNYGISAIGMAQYLKRCPTVAEMKNLTEPLAKKIAKQQYWDQVQGDKINSQALAHLIFDITYGSSYGPLHVRQSINAIKGPGTVKEFKSFTLSDPEIKQINSIDSKKLFSEIYKRRLQFYSGLTYGKGLTNRLNKLSDMYMQGMDTTMKFTQRNFIPLLVISGAFAVGLYFLLRKK